MEDNLMPSDGTFLGGVPREPLDQIVERKQEQAQTLQAEDEIRKVVSHFEERINDRDSLESIILDPLRSPELHLRACIVNDAIKDALMEEKEMLEELIGIYAKNKR